MADGFEFSVGAFADMVEVGDWGGAERWLSLAFELAAVGDLSDACITPSPDQGGRP